MCPWSEIIKHVKHDPELCDIYVATEEYSGRCDVHGRFLFKFSRRNNVERPVVSAYLVENGFLRVEWPRRYKFAVCLTHDVDFIYPPMGHIVDASKKTLRNWDISEFSRRLLCRLIRKFNPYLNFKNIMTLEEEYGACSSFFFKASRKEYGQRYDVEKIREELLDIIERGWEVGLHAGYYSYNDPQRLKEEKERLEKVVGRKILGVRVHYLRFKVPDTWRILAEVGFKYDTTFGYADMPGFRNGMCHPFKPCTIDGEMIDIWEIPLTIMDTTLYGYLHIKPREAFEKMKLLAKQVEKYNGVLTILWHNNTFDELRMREWSQLYRALLSYLKSRKAWMTCAMDIYEYWSSIYG
ncbi:MAG: hypothetical protein DRJ47_08145 [Thermoprotei archaeon]|nr:MAG: hypothetical protein DRJ47_08145 [Thermoprotei archaeon]